MEKKLKTCLTSIRGKTDFSPKVALILGSGLGDYADGDSYRNDDGLHRNRRISSFYSEGT